MTIARTKISAISTKPTFVTSANINVYVSCCMKNWIDSTKMVWQIHNFYYDGR